MEVCAALKKGGELSLGDRRKMVCDVNKYQLMSGFGGGRGCDELKKREWGKKAALRSLCLWLNIQ